MSTADTPTERLKENATEVASLLVLGAGLTALFSGFAYFWVIFVIGFAVFVPLVALTFGDEEDRREWWDDDDDWWDSWWGGWGSKQEERRSESDREVERETDTSSTTDTPLETVRRRYARGELTDAQFERKLELLLETETLEDAEDRQRARELVREHES